VTRIARERGVITKEPESRDASGRLGDTLYVETTLARNDDHATDRWCASEAREALRPRWKHKEPVPREEGRLH
jgi:hypothetical protein